MLWGSSRRLVTHVAVAAAVVVVAAAAPAVAPGKADAAAPQDANVHLATIVQKSPAPYYRRFGTQGMVDASQYEADVLSGAGLTVLRHDRTSSSTYLVDYANGPGPGGDHRPLLKRARDGHEYKTDSALEMSVRTGPAGITCTVRLAADVTPGDCAFIPFELFSPEWKNPYAEIPAGLQLNYTETVTTALARGAVGLVLQGDVDRDATVAVKVRKPVPAVVTVAEQADLVGERVTLRAMGSSVPATLHNVVAIRPPSDPSLGYVMLQAHLDGYYAAAADNGSGAAAVLAAAQQLAGDSGRGLVVALYDGEEWGILGSAALAKDLLSPNGVTVGECGPTLRMNDLVAVVNLDASSAKPSDATGTIEDPTGATVPIFSYRVMVSSDEPTLASTFVAQMAKHQVLGLPINTSAATDLNGGLNRTDGRDFEAAGVPVAWPVAGYPEYHTSADTLATVDPTDLTNIALGAVDTVRALATATLTRVRSSALAAPGAVAPPAADPSCSAPTAVPELGRPGWVLLGVAVTISGSVRWSRRRRRAA